MLTRKTSFRASAHTASGCGIPEEDFVLFLRFSSRHDRLEDGKPPRSYCLLFTFDLIEPRKLQNRSDNEQIARSLQGCFSKKKIVQPCNNKLLHLKISCLVCVRACISRRAARCGMAAWVDLAFPVCFQSSDPNSWSDCSTFGELFVCSFDKPVVVHTR